MQLLKSFSTSFFKVLIQKHYIGEITKALKYSSKNKQCSGNVNYRLKVALYSFEHNQFKPLSFKIILDLSKI